MASGQNDVDRGELRRGRERAARAARTRQAVKEELHELFEDMEEFLRRVGAAADPELDLLRGKVQNAIDSSRRAIESGIEWPTERAREAWTASDAYVHEQPWRVVAAASLVGIVIGALTARR